MGARVDYGSKSFLSIYLIHLISAKRCDITKGNSPKSVWVYYQTQYPYCNLIEKCVKDLKQSWFVI